MSRLRYVEAPATPTDATSPAPPRKETTATKAREKSEFGLRTENLWNTRDGDDARRRPPPSQAGENHSRILAPASPCREGRRASGPHRDRPNHGRGSIGFPSSRSSK